MFLPHPSQQRLRARRRPAHLRVPEHAVRRRRYRVREPVAVGVGRQQGDHGRRDRRRQRRGGEHPAALGGDASLLSPATSTAAGLACVLSGKGTSVGATGAECCVAVDESTALAPEGLQEQPARTLHLFWPSMPLAAVTKPLEAAKTTRPPAAVSLPRESRTRRKAGGAASTAEVRGPPRAPKK